MAREHDEDADGGTPEGLDSEDRREIRERKAASSRIVHEVIREQGEEELERSSVSLLFSALAAGVAMNASILARAFIRMGLPEGAPWVPVVDSIGYTLGFLIVVLGGMQLFTESTVTVVLPLATSPSWAKLRNLLRLWTLVFVANMAGTLLVAWMIAETSLLDAKQVEAVMAVSRDILKHDGWHILMLGIPSGFLVGCIAWMLPNNRGGSEFWIVFALTYLIGLGGFSHVVAGSTEAWSLLLAGEIDLARAVGGIVLPSLLGNIVGGTLLFAVLAHGQVRGELDENGDGRIGGR